MMKDFIRLLSMAILAMMCFLSCKNTQKEMEEFLKKEIVAEFTNKGIEAAIEKNSLKLQPDGEDKFKGSVRVLVLNEIDTFEYDLSVSIEGKSIQWKMEETEASVLKHEQKREEEAQRQERERRHQEENRRREEENRRRKEEARMREEQTRREQEAAQRNEMERQARIYKDLQRIDEIKRQLPSLYSRWRIAVISNDYNADVYYMNKVKDLRDEADRIYLGLSYHQSIDRQALYQDKRNFNYWCDDMLHQVTMARYSY